MSKKNTFAWIILKFKLKKEVSVGVFLDTVSKIPKDHFTGHYKNSNLIGISKRKFANIIEIDNYGMQEAPFKEQKWLKKIKHLCKWQTILVQPHHFEIGYIDITDSKYTR